MNLKKMLSMLMTFVLLFTSINLPVSAASDSFKDAKGHWAEKNINWSQEMGLVKGYPDGEFKPEGKITKAEFITIINNFMKAEKGRDFKFKDVKKSDWYYEEVRKAVNYYLKDEEYFKGDEYINRDEASKLIAAAYGLKKIELNNFKDSDEIVNKGAVGSLVKAKILNGYPDGKFKPKNPITRAEASKIFNVAYDNIGTPNTNNALNPNKEEKVEVKSNTLTSEKNIKNHRHSSSSHHNHNSNNDSNDNSKPMYPIGPSEPVNPGEETKTLEQIKSDAKSKIDDLKNLSDDEKKIIKEKIDTATTEKEINAIVKEAKDQNDKENNEDKKDSVKFGVISDIHLDPNNGRQVERTTKALNFFEDNGAASSFIVGDVTNNGTEAQYKEYEKVKAARAGSKMEVHASMGNHEGGTRNLFTKYYGDQPNAHYKIDGYHFITVSPDGNGWSGNYSKASKWLSEELKKAKADTGDKPIFVFFHHPIKDTFYVSEEWYGDISKDVFKDYPMAITFSGHIHSPNNHPRSIWQDKFTAVNTVSLYYFEMESGYNNGNTHPKQSDQCAQGMLIEADGTKVTIKNRDFISDKWIDETWTFDTAHPEKFPYTDARYNDAKAPKFEDGTEITSKVDKTSVDLEFNQAKVDPDSVEGDIVHSYEFEIKENDKVVKTVKDWSGFYLIPMPQKMSTTINGLKANTKYTVDIYPVDAFKKKGEPITTSFTTGEKPYMKPTPNILDVDINKRPDGSDANGREMKVVGNPEFTKDSVKFDGTNGLRYTTDSKVYKDINNYGFTAELYYIPNNLSENTDPMGNTQSSGFCFEEKGDGKTVEFWVNIGGEYYQPKAELTQGELVHLLATYDKEEIKLYKNGKLVDTVKAPGDVMEPPHFIFLGGDTTTDGNLEFGSNAEIKMARVYTGYMNEDEVKEAYTKATSKNPVEPGEDSGEIIEEGNDTGSVKFGVISDIHLQPGDPKQVERTSEALNFFEENGAASSFIVGDVTDNGREEEYREYNKVKEKRTGNKMTVHASMGNHENLSTDLFTKYFGDKPNNHYKINGYHFITVSPDRNNENYSLSNINWLSEELKKAKADTGDKPIFVFFHHPIKDTFYVSDEWYGNISKEIFKDYPMAVTFSGHIHSPNNHPRSIWQDNFTAVNTVSLYYFEMESGYNNGSTYPKNKDLCAQGMLIEADGTKVTIKNRDFISDDWINQTWTFDTAHPEDFPYTDKRYDEAKAPKFEDGTEVKVTDMNVSEKNASVNLEFNQAKVDPDSVKGDIVYSYELKIKEEGKLLGKTVKDWSGFYLIPMPEKMNMKLDELKANTKYTVDIYPVDAFKKKGNPITVTFTTSTEPSELKENIDLKPYNLDDFKNSNMDFEEKEFNIIDKEDSFKDNSKNSDEKDANSLEGSFENNSNIETEV